MSIPREFIELLLAKIDIVDLINTHLPLRKKSGSNYFARCPFHNEKSASFSVSQTKQFYYCFGCGAHGNAIDFLMQQDRLTFPEAIEQLARQAGLEIPKEYAFAKKEESHFILYDFMTEIANYYYEQMRQSPRAIQYLKNRGISGQIAQQFQLGYAPAGWSHVLDNFGKTEVDKKKLLDAGLIIKKTESDTYYDRFRDRIQFPIHDYRGRIVGFGGRILDQGEPKYLNSPETPLFQKGHELYGLYQALKIHKQFTRILLVEGYMDVIALFQHGITYAVATLGTATTSHHIERLIRYTSELVFCFDGDQAGRTAAWRALETLLPLMQDHLQARFLFLPDGEDPDSLIRKEGQAAFEKRLSHALPFSEFFLQTLSQSCDMQTLEGRAKLVSQALAHLKQLPTGILQSLLLQELHKRTRIPLEELKEQLHGKATPTLPEATPAVALTKTKLASPIRIAIAMLLQYPKLAELITEPLPSSDLPGLAFFNQLLAIINKNPKITSGALLENWRGQKEESFIAKLVHEPLMTPEEGIHQEFKGRIRQLIGLNLEEGINRLLAKAANEILTEEEKIELSTLITKKKALI